MATLSSLSVILKANTSGFASGMKRASASLVQFGKSVARTALRVGKLVAGIGSLVAGGGLVILTKRAIDATDALAKMSARIGTTTEQLSRLQFAGELTGVAATTLNMAMQRMTRRVSEAAMGTGEAVKALQEMRIDAVKLAALPLDKKMATLAEAMTTVIDPADRVRVAFKLFDSEGVALLNLLSQGADGMEAMADESDRLGNTISSFDATAIELVSDAWTRIKASAAGIGRVIASSLAPTLEFAMDRMADWNAAAQNFFRNFITVGLPSMIQGVTLTMDKVANSFVFAFAKIEEFVFQSISKITKEIQKLAFVLDVTTGLLARNLGISSGTSLVTALAPITAIGSIAEGFAGASAKRAEQALLQTEITDSVTGFLERINTDFADRVKAALEKKDALGISPNIEKTAVVATALKFQLPGAIERGSAAEQRLVAQRKQTETQAEILATQKQQLREATMGRRLMEEVVRAVSGLGVTLEPI